MSGSRGQDPHGQEGHGRTHASPSGIFTEGGPPSDPALERDPLLASVPATPRGRDGVGRFLGGVRLVKKLGQGGMGAVYSGWHTAMGALVAVKVLPRELVANDRSYAERFLREARISFQISHPHLVSAKDVGQEHGILFLVMELVEGKSAQRLSDEKGPLPEAEAVAIVHDASLGLAEAHRAKVIHRDVKPDNILVRARDGQAKLADLGLARATLQKDVTLAEPLTIQGTALGTPLFMAPEQTLDAHAVGAAADVWSMGASLFALLAGKAPFMARDLLELYEAIRTAPTPDLAKLRPDVSAATVALVRHCLEKEPARRPRDASALAEELGRIRAALSAPPPIRLAATIAEAKTIPLVPAPSQHEPTHVTAPTIPPTVPFVPAPPLPLPLPLPEKPAAEKGLGAGSLALAALLVAVGLGGFAGAIGLVFFVAPPAPKPKPSPTSVPIALASPRPTPAPSPLAKPTPATTPIAPTPVAKPTPAPSPSPETDPPPDMVPEPSPEPSPLAKPTPTAPTPTPTAPAPAPATPTSPAPVPSVPVAQLAPEERTWDGHLWRRNAAGHRHTKPSPRGDPTCGHFFDAKLGGWKLTKIDPRENTSDLTDEERANPASGVYDYAGKTWFLRGHVHGGCYHELVNGRWRLKDPDP